jgi:16S rRNA A1518/A1519 N6-dimethyltransferase RsmA/KsgA/DIM1 with predicted DNA glycosylase/AP lyase activity
MCTINDFQKMSLCQGHMINSINEIEDWHKYLIPFSKKIQVDIGAGCGETAFVYLNHGVEKVICIEGNKECLINLRKNFGNDDRVVIVPYFVDNIKVDIDRGEKNMIIETHFPYRLRKLKSLPTFTEDCRLNVLEEYWGNPLRKALRLLGRKLL